MSLSSFELLEGEKAKKILLRFSLRAGKNKNEMKNAIKLKVSHVFFGAECNGNDMLFEVFFALGSVEKANESFFIATAREKFTDFSFFSSVLFHHQAFYFVGFSRDWKRLKRIDV